MTEPAVTTETLTITVRGARAVGKSTYLGIVASFANSLAGGDASIEAGCASFEAAVRENPAMVPGQAACVEVVIRHEQ